MPGRHSTTKRPSRAGPILAAVVAVAVIVALGVYLAPRLTEGSDASNCDEPHPVSLATPPEMKAAMTAAVATMQEESDTDDCVTITVNTVHPDSSLFQIDSSANTTPTVWILDSRTRLAELDPSIRPQVEVYGNAATTPVIVAASVQASHDPPASWQAAFESNEFVLPDPSNSVASAFALAALTAEVGGDETEAVLLDLAEQQAASDETVPIPEILLKGSRLSFTPAQWFPVTEQSYVSMQTRHVNWRLTAMVPDGGTTFLDYPIVTRTDLDSVADETAQQLTEYLSTTLGSATLGTAGFRSPSGARINSAALGPDLKTLKPPTSLTELLTAWTDAQAAVG